MLRAPHRSILPSPVFGTRRFRPPCAWFIVPPIKWRGMRVPGGRQNKLRSKILASREEAAQMLSISQRALDYLIATRRLPTWRIDGRVLIPVSELRKYARTDRK